MQVPLIVQLALLLVSVSLVLPVLAAVVLGLVTPFLKPSRRRDAHRCLDKLLGYASRERASLVALGRVLERRSPVEPP